VGLELGGELSGPEGKEIAFDAMRFHGQT